MGAVASFVYADWSALFPEFGTTVTQPQATALFSIAVPAYINNSGGGPVNDLPTQTYLTYLVLAHLAQLQYGSSKQDASALVGHIDSAAEGSVNVSVSYEASKNQQFWTQTQYGAMYWEATKRFRVARPFMPPPYNPNPWFGRGQ
jgi:Protein of unknown function (DUF4054)